MTPERMSECFRSAVRQRIGYIYVTDAGGGMPWGRLPRYWDAEVAAVLEVNRVRDP